jgi:hypothetical protein
LVRAEAARRAGVAWTDTTFTLGAEIPDPGDEGCGVCSPVLRRIARVSAVDARFLRQFTGGATVSHLIGAEKASASLPVFLLVQKYVRLGVLVEELVLAPAEIGDLCVGGSADTLRVGELSRGRAREARSAPLTVCRRPDGALALLETEAGCAAFLEGRPQRVRLLQPADFLRRAADAPSDFFGTLRGGVPYQSICHDGEELVAGRRRALYERLALVRTADLMHRAVLDLGCNIGMNCYLAVELGARAATGVDRPGLVSVAARLNAFYGRACRFVAADVNDAVRGLGRHETVFVFSLLGHLRTAEGVLRTIDHAGARVVYVETHRDGDLQGELQRLIEDDRFGRVEFVGHCESSAYEDRLGRSLYRCELRGARR